MQRQRREGRSRVEFRILGPVEVVHEGRALPLPGGRERALLALLLLSANRVVSAERLAADLWDDAPSDGGLQALRVFVSRLRKVPREAGADGILATKSPGYLFLVEPGALDAARFEALVTQRRDLARRDDQTGAAALRLALQKPQIGLPAVSARLAGCRDRRGSGARHRRRHLGRRRP